MINWFPERCSHPCSRRDTLVSLGPECCTTGYHCICDALANFKPGYHCSFHHRSSIANYTHALCRFPRATTRLSPFLSSVQSPSVCACSAGRKAWSFHDVYCDSCCMLSVWSAVWKAWTLHDGCFDFYCVHSGHRRTRHRDLAVLPEPWWQWYCFGVYDYIEVLYFQKGPSLPWMQSLNVVFMLASCMY